MGMTVKLETNPGLVVEWAAARRRGLQDAGELLLASAIEGAPRETGEPRHGVHGADTGFVRVEPLMERVAIGFLAFWMLWQHEDLLYHHQIGHAKFLELAILMFGNAALELVAARMRAVGGE